MLKKMKRAGINWLAYGIDDFKCGMTNRKIRDIVKMTQDAGIAVMGNFIFGFWEDSMKKMLLRLDFAAKTLYEYVNFYCLTAYPGSKIRESYKEEDLPTKWEQYAQTSPEFKPLPTKYLKGSEVLKFRDEAFKRYFSNPDYQDMVNNKFGANAVSEVNDMLQLPFRRK